MFSKFLLISFFVAATAKADVVVPVPQALAQSGKITVVGVKGSGQSEKAELYKFDYDANGTPIAGSAKSIANIKLNEPFSARPGYYFVRYSGTSSGPIALANDANVGVYLKKISVPKLTGQFEFNVFLDYTNPSMRTNGSFHLWIYYSQLDLCKSGVGFPQGICEKVKQGYQAYLDFMDSTRYDKTGSIVWYKDDGKIWEARKHWVVDPKDGEFVSVFPGTYGIEFKDNQGNSETQYGIEVKPESTP